MNAHSHLAKLVVSLLLVPAALAAQPVRVSGHVWAPDDSRGMAGARVELLPAWEKYEDGVRRLQGGSEPSPLATARTDAEGFYELNAPEAGAYRLRVRLDGYLAMEHPLVPLFEDADLPALLLTPAEPFEVRLVSGEGKPLAGVAVQVTKDGEDPAQHQGWRFAERGGVTAPDGRLPLSRSRREALKLVAVSPAFLGQSAKLGEKPQPVRLLPAPAGGQVEVKTRDGKPVPGALVRWRSWPVGTTGADGRLALAFPAGDEPLVVESRDGGSAQGTAPPGKASILSLRLEPPRIVTGQAVQKAPAKPVPGALVWTGDRLLGPPVRAGVDGRFQLTLSRPGEIALEAAAPGYLRTASRLKPLPPPAPNLLRLEPAARLSGLVVDPGGRPVSQAYLRVATLGGNVTTLSRPDGGFVIGGLRFQGSYEIRAFRRGFTSASLKTRTPAPGQVAKPVRIVLGAGSTAVGQVVDEAGTALPGVSVVLTSAGNQRFPATTDGEGRFEIRALEPGRFMLRARLAGFSPVRRAVEVAADPRRTDLGAIELPAGIAIEGEVTDTQGLPIAAASVETDLRAFDDLEWVVELSLPSPAVQTGPDGRFRIADLPRKVPLQLHIEHEGYVPLDAPGVEAPTREVLHFELKPARSLAGRVVTSDGKPVPDASLTRLDETRTQRSFSRSTTPLGSTDANGNFRVTGLEPGPADLQVEAEGFATRTVRGVVIPKDRDVEGYEIVLDRGTILAVRVLSSDGAPMAGVRVEAQPEKPRAVNRQGMDWPSFHAAAGETGEEGTVRLEVPEPGTYRLQAASAGRSISDAVQAGQGTTPAELRFPPGVEVSGRVVNGEGEGIARVALALNQEAEGTFWQSAMTEADGSFVFRQVPDGAYRLGARLQGYVQSGGPLETRVAGADVTGLGIAMEAEAQQATLRGRLLGLAPEEMARASVRGFGGSGFAQAQVEPDGRYELQGLKPGDWHVTAAAANRRQIHQQVTIQPGDSEATLDFDFGKGATLSGRVLVDGAPLSGASLTLRGDGNGGQAASRYDGSFEIHDLAAGRYSLSVVGGRGAVHQESTVEIDGDRDVTIDIAMGALLGQVVSGATGEPVGDALVTIEGKGSEPRFSFFAPTTRSGDDGAFDARLAAGTYKVTIQKEGYAPVVVTAEVRAGEPAAPLAIRLSPARR
ncbi:MAG TPA: carboxypeptidase regulatory-like domain-containing protein [Thermoanaerobaculia bacterium]|nr:carboxypeptidase regulatory-like domain-containing protein [Thermoanaerobaculia bacterium]